MKGYYFVPKNLLKRRAGLKFLLPASPFTQNSFENLIHYSILANLTSHWFYDRTSVRFQMTQPKHQSYFELDRDHSLEKLENITESQEEESERDDLIFSSNSIFRPNKKRSSPLAFSLIATLLVVIIILQTILLSGPYSATKNSNSPSTFPQSQLSDWSITNSPSRSKQGIQRRKNTLSPKQIRIPQPNRSKPRLDRNPTRSRVHSCFPRVGETTQPPRYDEEPRT